MCAGSGRARGGSTRSRSESSSRSRSSFSSASRICSRHGSRGCRPFRSGEGRVGEEGRSRGGPDYLKKKKKRVDRPDEAMIMRLGVLIKVVQHHEAKAEVELDDYGTSVHRRYAQRAVVVSHTLKIFTY